MRCTRYDALHFFEVVSNTNQRPSNRCHYAMYVYRSERDGAWELSSAQQLLTLRLGPARVLSLAVGAVEVQQLNIMSLESDMLVTCTAMPQAGSATADSSSSSSSSGTESNSANSSSSTKDAPTVFSVWFREGSAAATAD
jgi:hypothetical protein